MKFAYALTVTVVLSACGLVHKSSQSQPTPSAVVNSPIPAINSTPPPALGSMTFNLSGIALVEGGSSKTVTPYLTDAVQVPLNFALSQDGKLTSAYTDFTFTNTPSMNFFAVAGAVYASQTPVAFATGYHGTPPTDKSCALLIAEAEGVVACLDYDAVASEIIDATEPPINDHFLAHDSKGAIFYIVGSRASGQTGTLYNIRKYTPATKAFTDLFVPVTVVDALFVNADDSLVYSIHDASNAATTHYVAPDGSDKKILDGSVIAAAKIAGGSIVYESNLNSAQIINPATGTSEKLALSSESGSTFIPPIFTTAASAFQVGIDVNFIGSIVQIYPTQKTLILKSVFNVSSAKAFGSTLLVCGSDKAGLAVLSRYDLNTGTETPIITTASGYTSISDFDLTSDGKYAVAIAFGGTTAAGYGLVADLTVTPPKVTAAPSSVDIISVVAIK